MNTRSRLGLLMMFSVLAAVSGCASNPTCDGDQGNFDKVTICPGASRICSMTPCNVYYLMPEGSGKYKVTGNGIVIGEFSAGKKVNLGAFWDSYYFDVSGADVPRAYVFTGSAP